MSIKVTGLRETRQMMARVENFLRSTKPMEGIVKGVKEEIEKKTAKARDYKNVKFESYSSAYAKKKGTTHVDLSLSGLMLASLETKVLNANHGRIFIKTQSYPGARIKTDLLANIHTTGTGKQPKREFMNISKSVMKQLQKKYYDDKIMKILGRK